MFFKRIVAKLHGVSMTKEFISPKKKQENTVKAITSGETTPTKGAGKSKGKAPALPKGTKGKGKGKKSERSQTPPSSTGKGSESKKGNGKSKPAFSQGKSNEPQTKPSTPTRASAPSASMPSVTPQPKPMLSKPGKIPRQCAYFAHQVDAKGAISVCIFTKWRRET